MQTNKVLLTGACGFTGKHLTQKLIEKGYDVLTFESDLTNKQAVFAEFAKLKPDYVIHLAAISFVGNEDLEAFYKVNLFGSLNLLEAIYKHNPNIQKIIMASSANVYGTPDVEVINENICPGPINHYAMSKLAMECMVKTWFDKLPIIITRPFNYTGPGQEEHFLIPKIVKHFAEKKTAISLGNIDVTRDFSDIDFVTEAYSRLLESNAHSEIFNLCSGVGHSIEAILKQMQEISGYKIEVNVDPNLVRANEIKFLIGNNAKLFKAIDKVNIIPFKDTLLKIYYWMLN